MAKTSVVQRELKRECLVKKHLKKRLEIKKMLQRSDISFGQRMDLQLRLQKLPKNSSPVRLHSRCEFTGRAHGFYRKFGLARNRIREAAMRGDIPGLVKASW